MSQLVMSEYNSDGDNQERDLLQSDDTPSLNSLTRPLLKAYSESGSTESVNHCRREIKESGLFEEKNRKVAKVCVMITVAFERAAFYGLVSNLAYFANAFLKLSSRDSAVVTLVFSGMTWFGCFLGGIFGDSVFGRFRTILFGLVCYIIGYVSLTLLADKIKQEESTGKDAGYTVWVVTSLIVISCGEGCFKANMSPFGADQVEKSRDTELRTFFNLFYWSINIGAITGYSVLAWVQLYSGFCLGYAIPCALLGLALMSFLIPRRKHYHVTSPNPIVMKIIRIFCNAARRKRERVEFENYSPMQHVLDRAKVQYGGKYLDKEVDDVKALLGLLPTLAFLVIYCSCYYMTSGVFLMQGIHMKIPDLGGNNVLPAAWLQLVNVVTVLICVPVVDRFVYPALDRFFIRTPYMFRISIGLLLASFSMLSAGLVEMHRLHTNGNCTNKVNNFTIDCKDMQIWFQLPQYCLMGVSEIFVLITGLEFAYCRAPRTMQSLVTSLFFMMNGFGAMLTSVFIYIGNAITINLEGYDLIQAQKPNGDGKIRHLKGHLDYFFFFMAVLNLMNWLFFVLYGLKQHKKNKQKDLQYAASSLTSDPLHGPRKRGKR